MKYKLFLVLSAVLAATLACGETASTPIPIPTLESSPFDLDRTLYGFFPSPPEVTIESVMATYEAIGEHGDVVLLQQNIPWKDFAESADAESSAIADIHNQKEPCLAMLLISLFMSVWHSSRIEVNTDRFQGSHC